MGDFEDFNFEDIIDENFSIVAEEINLSDTEEKDENKVEQVIYPILPVRNMLMFPGIVVPITAGREQSK